MAPRLSFVSICLCILLSILVASQRGRVPIHPEFIPESSDQIPKASPYSGNNPQLEGVSPGGKPQPFLGRVQDGYDVATLQPLLASLATTISDLNSQINKADTSVDLATVTVPSSAAELGCSIYSAYQKYCSVASTFTPSTYCLFPDITTQFCATTSASEIFASCACYSSTYWVPDLYDNAVWACNQISGGNTDFTASVTTIAGEAVGFCEENNPREAKFAYGLASTTATASSTSPAKTSPTPAGTPQSTPSPTSPVSTQPAPSTTNPTSSANGAMVVGPSGIRWMSRAMIGIFTIMVALI